MLAIIFLLMTLVGAASMVWGYRTWRHERGSDRWQTVTGTIIESSMTEGTDPDFEGTVYSSVIGYEYTVGGQRYESRRVKMAPYGITTDRETVQRRLDEYPVGKSVTVYVDPRKHSQAALEPGVNYVLQTFACFIDIKSLLCTIVCMRLKDYAIQKGVHYRTAYRWFKAGKIRGYQMDTGTIIITEDETHRPMKVAVYARVSSAFAPECMGSAEPNAKLSK